ncbi:hypothetical protein [Terribacillus saccharophilus]|uniref:Uncharacterized protein n=1 Tax=Terribacillus saccharophilus TaxID=361277 RepID=A0ABX4H0G1_9BACI|nr:hypothetical protein [Terribacillus saccharophilus]PAD35962.1 hypothetical protein CHH56_05925 [Terribacillus saccharophilus]PAD96988.1 hypothetical protein CHH50_06385 [Terribacillus saccharophilus]PAE00564.1 hypothetical protein CHH48_07290 [Terribacillus saccharophilus]
MSDMQTVNHLQSVIHDTNRSLEDRCKAETVLAELYLNAYPMPDWLKERLIDSFGEMSTLDYIAGELVNRYQVTDETPSLQWISAEC